MQSPKTQNGFRLWYLGQLGPSEPMHLTWVACVLLYASLTQVLEEYDGNVDGDGDDGGDFCDGDDDDGTLPLSSTGDGDDDGDGDDGDKGRV